MNQETNEFIKSIGNVIGSPAFALISSIISLTIGIVATRHFSARRKAIHSIETASILSDELTQINKMEITYNNERIKTLFKSILTISNKSATESFVRSDISSKKPLSIKCENGKILFAMISKNCKEQYNAVIIDMEDGTKEVQFEYLNCQDAIEIDILHTDIDVKFDGAIRGVKKILKLEVNNGDFSMSIKSYFVDVSVILVSWILIFILIFLINSKVAINSWLSTTSILVPLIGSMVLFGIKINTIVLYFKNKNKKK